MSGPPPGWGPPPGPWGYGPYPAPPPQTHTNAIIGICLAIVSYPLLFLCYVGPIFAIAALILVQYAARDIAASGGRYTGQGLVTATRILAWINLALLVALVLFVVLAFATA